MHIYVYTYVPCFSYLIRHAFVSCLSLLLSFWLWLPVWVSLFLSPLLLPINNNNNNNKIKIVY